MDIIHFIEKLGFEGDLFTYSKEYKFHNYTIKIDLQKEKIFYRKDENTTVERQEDEQIQLGDHTTSNLSIPENFVVLECVNRLLEKGYAPNDIHLERKWKVGHGASGGKVDINIYNKSDGKTLLIIECKTWGVEFEKEKNKMEEHGGQLFSYLNQEKNAQFLVLYASKFENDEFVYDNLIVQVKDRKEDLGKSLKQIEEENIKLYRDAKNKTELYDVWKESFIKYFHFNGIFDDDANAYSLELKALKKKNLKKLDDAKGLFNKFAEILRHNNISDNANAFNRVLSLFLCKIVDEEKKGEDVLGFQVKEDEEYEHIIDRLQALYQKGMAKLKEEIIYYSEEDLHKIIRLYPKQTPIEKVEAIFRELKYYTNNEFAFKEVHNKKLFQQNARVLVEVIKLIQNYQFRFTSKQQVLGDFFELMLNHGVKQSEGQFFTPIPIVRYIILSLGFENIINEKLEKEDTEFLPKILDYACGAGHFLTESIEELQQLIKGIDETKYNDELNDKIIEYSKGTDWAADYIFGIEKDYRLARTSQIACYINGDGDANIIFGDGLEEQDRLNLNKRKFDVVVANPPYSVEAFRNYLNVGKTHFELFESLTERSKEIEVLFIERTKQVLADGGLAGLILPSSILSNTGLYSKAREILLKHFEIKGITELGSKTFVATGTTTVILFLKRRNGDFLKDREYIASDLFSHTKYAINIRYINAEHFLKMFTEHRGFAYDDYERFLIVEINGTLAKTAMFKEYQHAFENSNAVKKLKTKNYFKNYTSEEKDKELSKHFYEYCKGIEKEKFLYFMLCLGDGHKNPDTINNYYKHQQIVVVKTGKDIEEQKEYLGYEFVGRKGQEGIKIYNYGGKMFDETNYENPGMANHYIRQAVEGNEIHLVSPSQENNIGVYRVVDLINFDRIGFEKQINLTAGKKYKIESKWGLVKLGNCLSDIIGSKEKIEQNEIEITGKIPVVSQESNKLISGYTNKNIEPITDLPLIIFGDHTCNFKYIDFKFVRGADGVVLLKPKNDFIPKYLYYFLKTLKIEDAHKYSRHYKHLRENSIPLPPKDIQQKIINEIEKIEKFEKSAQEKSKLLNEQIGQIFSNKSQNAVIKKLDEICVMKAGKFVSSDDILSKNETNLFPCYGGNGLRGYTKTFTHNGKYPLVGRQGALCGNVHKVEGIFHATEHAIVVTARPNINVDWLFHLLKSLNLNQYAKGVAQPGLSVKNIYQISVNVLPLDEQKKIVAIIDKKEKEIEKLKLALSTVEAEKDDVLKKYL